MLQRFEGHFKGFDHNELFFQTWTPENVRGVFVITHGLAEHGDCYHPLARVLADDGWQVFAWDLRGHGRSEGKRGFVMSVASYMDDLGCFLTVVRQQAKAPSSNMVLFGHSMGGLITLRYLQQHRVDYAALALSSPCLGLTVPVPKLKQALAVFAMKWMPSLTMHNEIKYTDLTHNQDMLQSYARDNLRHDKISPGLFLTMVENFPLVLDQAAEIQNPVLMQLAGDDRLVSTPISREFFARLPNKKNQMIVYPESFHEVFNDHEREQAIADLKKFVNPYLGA